MLLASDLAVLDHCDGTVLLIANAINHNDLDTGVDEAYADAVARLDAMTADLARPAPTSPAVLPASELPEFSAPVGRRRPTRAAVEDIKERIRAGEAFQVVPSQRFETPCSAARARRLPGAAGDQPQSRTCTSSASPTTTGASTSSDPAPRRWSRSRTGTRWCTPSRAPGRAGRRRSRTTALAEELLADPKERAEHLMLVDLGRNDLGRVCEPGSVEVVDFMSIERYSHVMHIVSTVTGQRRRGPLPPSTC